MMRAADLGVQMPALPVDRSFSPDYGVAVEVAPGVRRVLARNPNPFTFHGTGTYIVGRGTVAVIDPGPALDEHVAAILAATRGETISHILVTHTHNDHSPAAAPLRAATGALVMGCGPHGSGRVADGVEVEEGGDRSYSPDVQLADGARVRVGDISCEAVFTPGHTSNHVCFAAQEVQAFFPGDHVMGWSTTVIAPPDGDMADYLRSLEKLLALPAFAYYPTHGNPIARPHDFVRALIAHRHAREAQIEACLAHGLGTIAEMVPVIYSEVDVRLHPAASRSVLAHLQHMVATGRVACEGVAGPASRYCRARG